MLVLFDTIKEKFYSSPILVHYDPSKLTRIACDDSNYVVGTVLSDVSGDGREHPIAFASPSLSTGERNFLQIEKEAPVYLRFRS